jgi:hypothetical protein
MAATLPYELSMLILDCLPISGDRWKVPLSKTALVCRGWTAHSQRKLFHSLVLSTSGSLNCRNEHITIIVRLATHTRLASYVSEIWFEARRDNLIVDLGRFAAAVLPNVKRLGVVLNKPGDIGTFMNTYPIIKIFDLRYHPRNPFGALKMPVQLQLTSCTISSTRLLWTNNILLELLNTVSRTSLRHLSVTARPYSLECWILYVSYVQAFSHLRHWTLSPPGDFDDTKNISLFDDGGVYRSMYLRDCDLLC